MPWQRGVAIVAGIFMVTTLISYPLIATSSPQGDVAFCLSCHAMEPQGQSYAASYHRTHGQVATCSNCHTGSLLQKYTDGLRHLAASLQGNYATPIAIRESSKQVVAGQCFRCHGAELHAQVKQSQGLNCLECHVGHNAKPVSATAE